MSGFILGTGSGILASAAVYYTLSTSLRESTAGLRSELDNSSTLLSSSFDPVKPPAPSSLIGPSASNAYDQSFGELVKQKWNETFTSMVHGVRSTDWTLVSKNIYESGQGVIQRISESTSSPITTSPSSSTSSPTSSSSSTSTSTSSPLIPSFSGSPITSSPVHEPVRAHEEIGVVPGTTGVLDTVDKLPETKINTGKTLGVDLRKDTYGLVGGNELKVELKRNAEKEGRRLV
ncbi:uncharacterized protein IL334_000554 [Kwoniella shivajii]|uniref:MICOS complex subunit MIC12 n=1 Tax=Kwoniella shivajii TaxID=564305 RepID=A0ABZ1CPQ5_9TREE|nr:hypothetical protein IL334_000554 [Kwoniella shivajii]